MNTKQVMLERIGGVLNANNKFPDHAYGSLVRFWMKVVLDLTQIRPSEK